MASVKKRADGKWRARYRDPDGKEHARHFARKIDADQWLVSVQSSIQRGEYLDPAGAKVTLRAYFNDWSERQVWAETTATAMALAVRHCTFADVTLGAIRRSTVEAWVKDMQRRDLAAGTIRTRVNNVRSVLRSAVRDRLIPRDPSEGVTLPRQRRAEHAMQIPTPDAVNTALNAAEDWFELYVALCAFGGLRLGEASAVQVGDVDFLRRQTHVQRQVQRADGGSVRITPPKYGSERVVFVPDELIEVIARHIEQIGVHGDEQWLFGNGRGEPPHQNTVGHWWRSLFRRSGLEPFRLHDLRHFYASGLIAAGCDVVTVQRALGHAKATTTLSTYSHLWPTAEDRTRAAASDLMRSIAPSREAEANAG
jgi:integrase